MFWSLVIQMAKLLKKVVTKDGFWKINSIWPKIKAKRERTRKYKNEGNAKLGGLVKELGFQVERSGKAERIKDFAANLSTDRGLANATIWQRCMWLKGVVLRAHYNGKIPRNSFRTVLALQATKVDYHIGPNCKEREFLTEDELKNEKAPALVRGILNFVLILVFSCTKWMASVSGNLFRVPDSQPSFSRP